MQIFLLLLIGLTAVLFAAKMIYVVSTVMVVRSTRGALYVSTTRKRIISFNFNLPGLIPEQVLRPAGSLHSDPIYIYRVT